MKILKVVIEKGQMPKGCINCELRTLTECPIIKEMIPASYFVHVRLARLDNCPLVENTGELSDGYHTFDELYNHRMILFAVICDTHRGVAWK